MAGRADIYRFAEAMTRHTSEVDVYHIGKWAGLGTRHGVQHFGDSAKQVRISTPVYRRLFYYLTPDECRRLMTTTGDDPDTPDVERIREVSLALANHSGPATRLLCRAMKATQTWWGETGVT